MNKIDLRQIGKIMGLPVYVDFASIRDYKGKGEVLSERDKKELLVNKMVRKIFNPVDEIDPMEEPGHWYIVDKDLGSEDLGMIIAGPFSTSDDAGVARSYIEDVDTRNRTFWIETRKM